MNNNYCDVQYGMLDKKHRNQKEEKAVAYLSEGFASTVMGRCAARLLKRILKKNLFVFVALSNRGGSGSGLSHTISFI
jgi:hypothetical protein